MAFFKSKIHLKKEGENPNAMMGKLCLEFGKYFVEMENKQTNKP